MSGNYASNISRALSEPLNYSSKKSCNQNTQTEDIHDATPIDQGDSDWEADDEEEQLLITTQPSSESLIAEGGESELDNQ